VIQNSSMTERSATAVTPGITAIRYAFPESTRSVQELFTAGLVTSQPELLWRFGFDRVHVAKKESPYDLAMAACNQLLQDEAIDPSTVGLLIYGGPQGSTAFTHSPTREQSNAAHRTTARFQFPGTRLQYELGLDRATVFGMDQTACTTLLAAVRVARSLCITENIDRALCVVSEFFPADAGREAIFNCTSDAAVAVLVERNGTRNRIAASTQVTKGYYWDPEAQRDELVASYFPTSKHVIDTVLAQAGWSPNDVSLILPHNVNRRSWEILLGLTQLSADRLWDRNLARDGHTLAGDNFINMADAMSQGAIQPGDRLLLFSYGYGAHWTALAVEA
jgi:3-oxoacyl-[acyl-carrier-protein] synthase-3